MFDKTFVTVIYTIYKKFIVIYAICDICNTLQSLTCKMHLVVKNYESILFLFNNNKNKSYFDQNVNNLFWHFLLIVKKKISFIS